ncbi:MAG: hypothetical protein GKR93_11165 [Gammaproteobacteria bacterium]|nr:hypothetical protein [Gammaproteobacteria bacterium]
MAAQLPDGFEDMESWVQEWAMSTQNLRWEKRLRSTAEELIAFYQAVQPRLEKILEHADQYEIGKLPEPSARLYSLALMVAEIAPNVELYNGAPDVPHSYEEMRFIAVHGNDPH